jgi:hypothetical protein
MSNALMAAGSDRHANTWQQTLEIRGAEVLTLSPAAKDMTWLGEDSGQMRHCTDAMEEAQYQYR